MREYPAALWMKTKTVETAWFSNDAPPLTRLLWPHLHLVLYPEVVSIQVHHISLLKPQFPLSPSIPLCRWPWVRLQAFSHFHQSYQRGNNFRLNWKTGLVLGSPNEQNISFQFPLNVTFLFTFSTYFSLLLVYESMWRLACAILFNICACIWAKLIWNLTR